jgi:hypothetical protein
VAEALSSFERLVRVKNAEGIVFWVKQSRMLFMNVANACTERAKSFDLFVAFAANQIKVKAVSTGCSAWHLLEAQRRTWTVHHHRCISLGSKTQRCQPLYLGLVVHAHGIAIKDSCPEVGERRRALGIDGDIAELGHTALPSSSRSDSANDNDPVRGFILCGAPPSNSLIVFSATFTRQDDETESILHAPTKLMVVHHTLGHPH